MALSLDLKRKIRSLVCTLLLLLAFYLLSVGPAAWVSLKISGMESCQRVLRTAYWPLVKLRNLPDFDLLDLYLRVFLSKEDADALQKALK
jgi:hypothetical protein